MATFLGKTTCGIALMILCGCGCQEGANMRAERARLATKDGEQAFAKLVNLGPQGLRELTDAFVNDERISTETWLAWTFDLGTKFGAEGQQQLAELESYQSKRCEAEKDFCEGLARKWATADWPIAELVSKLGSANAGDRRLAYSITSLKFTGVPEFDYAADEARRKDQIQQIQEFLKKKQ